MKKFLALIVTLLLIFQVNIIAFADTTPTVFADDVVLTENETLIPIKIEGNSGLMGFKFNVKYDSTKVKIKSVTKGDFCSKGNFVTNFGTNDSTFDVVWNYTENITSDGTLFTLSAKSEDGANGSSKIELSYSQPDTFDVTYKDVKLDCKSIDVSFSEASKTTTKVTTESNSTTVKSNTWVADDKQFMEAVDTTLRQEGVESLDDVKDKYAFIKELNKNLNTITGSNDNKIVDFDSLKDTYKNSYSNEFIKEVTNNIDDEKVQEILNDTLKEYGVDDVRKLSDEDKPKFIKEFQQKLQDEDADVPNISEDLSTDEAVDVISKLDKSTEPDETEEVTSNEQSNSKNIWIIAGSVVAVIAVIAIIILLILKRKNRSKR